MSLRVPEDEEERSVEEVAVLLWLVVLLLGCCEELEVGSDEREGWDELDPEGLPCRLFLNMVNQSKNKRQKLFSTFFFYSSISAPKCAKSTDLQISCFHLQEVYLLL